MNINYDTYINGDLNKVIVWRNEINEVISEVGFSYTIKENSTLFIDNDGNEYEIFIGSKAQTCITLWQEYDEEAHPNGYYLMCALETMLSMFGIKIFSKSKPMCFGYAIDFLYVSKEVFRETLKVYIKLLRAGRYKLNEKIVMNKDGFSANDDYETKDK
jgi:hypothetical protein